MECMWHLQLWKGELLTLAGFYVVLTTYQGLFHVFIRPCTGVWEFASSLRWVGCICSCVAAQEIFQCFCFLHPQNLLLDGKTGFSRGFHIYRLLLCYCTASVIVFVYLFFFQFVFGEFNEPPVHTLSQRRIEWLLQLLRLIFASEYWYTCVGCMCAGVGWESKFTARYVDLGTSSEQTTGFIESIKLSWSGGGGDYLSFQCW